MNRVPLFIVLALCASFSAGANELQMIISGRSIHLGGNDLNENNYGFGLQYDFAPQRRWIPLINMASLKDSNGNTSKYIGAGMKRRFKLNSGGQRLRFDLGAAALVMRRPDYNDDQPFLAALPFVALSNDWGGINVTYVPRIEENALSFWYLQFTVKLLEF